MLKRCVWMLGIGCVSAALRCGGAEPGVAWPEEWVAFGPVPPGPAMRAGGGPARDQVLPDDALRRIPDTLRAGDLRLPARPMRPEDGLFDLGRAFGGGRGTAAYLLATVKAEADTTIRIGAGADWWMQWWVDGRPVFDTLAAGNGPGLVTDHSHVFRVPLSKGEHTLAVAVLAGSTSFILRVASPEELSRRAAARTVPAVSGVVWPRDWTLFGVAPGPYADSQVSTVALPPDADLASIPRELRIGKTPVTGRPVSLTNGALNLAAEYPHARRLYAAVLMAPVTAERDVRVRVGAGANWWMRWWLDGQPVFDTLPSGNLSVPCTARDHVFELDLTRGAHVLAVAVIAGNNGFGLAVAGPDELAANPPTYQDLMEAGRQKYWPPHWSVPIAHGAAASDFRRALDLADTDERRAVAQLAWAQAFLQDPATTNFAELRAAFEAVRALPGADFYRKMDAAIGLGETWSREGQGDRAREAFALAGRGLSDDDVRREQMQLRVARSYLWEGRDREALEILDALAPVMAEVDRRSGSPGFSFEVRLYRGALETAPKIRPGHPRLFFNRETWPAVRDRVLADTNGLNRIRTAVDALAGEPDPGAAAGILLDAALLCRATGDAALFRNIRRLLRVAVDHFLTRTDFNTYYLTRLGAVCALDWLWDEFPPDEREGLVRDFTRYLHAFHTDLALRHVTRNPYYYEPAIFWYAGLAFQRPGLDPAERMRWLAVLGHGLDGYVHATLGQNLALMQADRGGFCHIEYNFDDVPTPLWSFLHCWRAAIGPMPAEWAFATGFAPSYMLRHAPGFGPNTYRLFGYGNAWRPAGGWMSTANVYHNLRQFLALFGEAEPDEARIAAWLRARMAEAGTSDSYRIPFYRYLLPDAGESPRPELPAGLPLARLYPRNGMLLVSSGFDPDQSAYALYSCGGTGGRVISSHYDAGHFTLYRTGYLALDSGTRALGESRPGVSGRTYDIQSVAHNTILIHMPGESLPNGAEANSGGQCRLPDAARVLAFETSPLFAYAATDLTDAYHSHKCARALRQFLFLPPDHFVVFDRVAATRPDYAKTWLLHTANEPRIEGKEFRADQDRGRLFCRTLLPADAVLEPVGGPGKEFWAGGRNWPIPETTPYLGTVRMTNVCDVPETMGRWRVEVKPGAARAEDCFLHLIEVGDRTALTAMTPSTGFEDDRTAGVEFQAGARTVRVAFAKDGDAGGHIRIAESGRVLADRPLTAAIQRQEGLALER